MKPLTLDREIRIRCRRCDRDLEQALNNSEIMDNINVIDFTCKQCHSSMEIMFLDKK